MPSESESESSSLSSSLSSWVSASVPSPPADDAAVDTTAAPANDGASEDGDGMAAPRVNGNVVESNEPAAGGTEEAGGVSSSPVDGGGAGGGRGGLLSRQKKERLDALTALVVGTAAAVLGVSLLQLFSLAILMTHDVL